jgi:hypothetical protein
VDAESAVTIPLTEDVTGPTIRLVPVGGSASNVLVDLRADNPIDGLYPVRLLEDSEYIFGTLLTIYSAITRSSLSTAGLVLAFVPLGLAGLLSLLWGISIDAWRRRAENTLSGWVRQWLAGTPRNKSGDNEPIVTRA